MPETDDIDSLIKTIGKERSSRSPQEIAEAENKLRQAVVESRDRVAGRARIVGTVLAVIGFLLGIWPIILLAGLVPLFSKAPPMAEDAPLLERALPTVFLSVAMLHIICGFALGAGAIGFRSLKHWGRKTILTVIWVAIGYCVSFLLFWQVSLFSLGPPGMMKLPMAFGGLIVTGFCVMLLWFAQRYFASEKIRKLCS